MRSSKKAGPSNGSGGTSDQASPCSTLALSSSETIHVHSTSVSLSRMLGRRQIQERRSSISGRTLPRRSSPSLYRRTEEFQPIEDSSISRNQRRMRPPRSTVMDSSSMIDRDPTLSRISASGRMMRRSRMKQASGRSI